MKICPTCRKTYTDENLNFCLEDGAVLNPFNLDDNSQPTVFMGQPPTTAPQTNTVSPTNANQTFPTIASTSSTIFQPAVQPVEKKSKALYWILGILGLFGLMGVFAFVGLVAYFASSDSSTPPDDNGNEIKKTDPKNSPTPIVFKNIQKENFSTWRVEKNEYGNTEYRGGEYIMSSKQAGYYYVQVTPNTKLSTLNSSTKVTVRNANGTSTGLGYGLLIHSDIKSPLVRDYGFLIDSSKQSYRVVQHKDLKESSLVQWTRFPAIRSGTQTNELEIVDNDGKISFYINGQFAVDIEDTIKPSDGVFGLYVGDGIPIAFSNLQIGK